MGCKLRGTLGFEAATTIELQQQEDSDVVCKVIKANSKTKQEDQCKRETKRGKKKLYDLNDLDLEGRIKIRKK